MRSGGQLPRTLSAPLAQPSAVPLLGPGPCDSLMPPTSVSLLCHPGPVRFSMFMWRFSTGAGHRPEAWVSGILRDEATWEVWPLGRPSPQRAPALRLAVAGGRNSVGSGWR